MPVLRVTLRLALLTLICSGPLFVLRAHAQERQPTAFLQAVEAEAFPEVAVRLLVSDTTGRGVSGLGPDVIQLLEDGQPIPDLAVSEREAGLQVVFVLNATTVFQPRDGTGTSRLDYVKQALSLWAGPQGMMREGLDDVTLVTPEGALIQHTSSPDEFQHALEGYAPDYTEDEPGFQLLQQALTFAADATPRPGMRRAVVLFSSWIPTLNDVPLTDAASRANEMRAPLYTFLAGPPGAESQPGAEHLPRLAELTGGAYAYFTSPEVVLPVFELLTSQREHYVLNYRSKLSLSGLHRLVAQVEADGLSAVTPPAEFALTVEPPTVTFISPPVEITRQRAGSEAQTAELAPASQELQLLIEFPDRHPRALTLAQLYVDGALADETQQAPFNRFTWNLAGYQQTGAHRLQVVVRDELGLEGATIEHPVRVEVAVESSTLRQAAPLLRPLAVMAGILLAGLALARTIAVILRRPRPLRPPRTAATPVRKHLPARTRHGKAYLEVVADDGKPSRKIELMDGVLMLGRDPEKAQAVFGDRSVSRCHARIVENGEGCYQVYDENSTSGTWLNLEPVGPGGAPLRHGDRVNLGRVQLVFHLRAAEKEHTPPPLPVSTPDTSRAPRGTLWVARRPAPPDENTEPFAPEK